MFNSNYIKFHAYKTKQKSQIWSKNLTCKLPAFFSCVVAYDRNSQSNLTDESTVTEQLVSLTPKSPQQHLEGIVTKVNNYSSPSHYPCTKFNKSELSK